MRYETTTKLAPKDVLDRAEQFFAKDYGLSVRMRGNKEIGFEGGGGHVAITVVSDNPTTLDLETREWDNPVLEFMGSLPR